jgi:hypothetical protein
MPLVAVVAGGGGAHRRPAAMYVFGDSTLDVGNNNYLPGAGVPRANRPYYGIDFPGFPTGRFSNGGNTADFIGTYYYSICYIYHFYMLMCLCVYMCLCFFFKITKQIKFQPLQSGDDTQLIVDTNQSYKAHMNTHVQERLKSNTVQLN